MPNLSVFPKTLTIKLARWQYASLVFALLAGFVVLDIRERSAAQYRQSLYLRTCAQTELTANDCITNSLAM